MTNKYGCELGNVMDEIAQRRGYDGPYNVGKYVYEKTGRGPKTSKKGQGSSAWSQIFHGETEAKVTTMRAFIEAMELVEPLSEEEQARLFQEYLSQGQLAAVAA